MHAHATAETLGTKDRILSEFKMQKEMAKKNMHV